MDIVKQKHAGMAIKLSARMRWVLAAAAIGVLTYTFMARASLSTTQLGRDALVMGVVKQGTFNVNVEGYGTLRSGSQRLITSVSKATVEQIVLKPGAKVDPDSIILRLSNPVIDQEVDLAWQQLQAEKANVDERALSQQRELQDEDVKLVEAQYALELAEFRKEKLGKVADQGVVSQMDYTEIKLKASQLARALEIQRQRYATMQQINAKKLEILGKLVAQRQLAHQTVLERKNKLVVRAGEAGVLQALYVELGQNIEAGAQLVLVGGGTDLNALIKVPQSKVDLVQLDQPARISIGDATVPAKVLRIDPTVVDGSVSVELSPQAPLPSSARPDLNIDASIDVGTYENALFVERPANIKPNSSALIYKLSNDERSAERVRVRFGQESGRLIQIEAALGRNDRIILSDLSQYSEPRIRIGK
jgi:biotin carboxyl carrier protein